MIRLENITLKSNNQTILENISLHLQEGEKVAIKGPSGCGKSSLLKIVAGAIKPHRGIVRFNGDILNAESIQQIRGALAFIGQEPVCGAETVRETLLLPFQFKAHAHNRPDETAVLEALSRLHLSAELLNKPCARISGGEKQRVAIARAFLLGKTIFIADEITSALDPVSKTAVLAQLFRPEFTIISASHDPDWLNACTRTLEMNDGKITGDHHADR
jgi:putative ABC transport system ATP-binding protein